MPEIVTTATSQLKFLSAESGAAVLRERFEAATHLGLIQLAKNPLAGSKTASVTFWQSFVDTFMRVASTFAEGDPFQVPVDKVLLDHLVRGVPPIKGAEYIDYALLEAFWTDLEAWMIAEVARSRSSARTYLSKEFPRWRDVGRIHFHLAENDAEGSQPFLFLATYAVRDPSKVRLQHRPLGLALKASLDQQQSAFLQELLRPIRAAADRSEFLYEQLQSKRLYSALPLGPHEAHRFLRDIPEYEQAGIICRLPASWQTRNPPRVKVELTLDTGEKSAKVGVNQLVRFHVNLAVEGARLTEEQWQKLLEQEDALVQINGRWVEVDRERVSKVLKIWNRAVSAAEQQGMSFAAAMRLLSRFGEQKPEQNAAGDDGDTSASAWLDVIAGQGLTNLLQRLRQPGFNDQEKAEAVLRNYFSGTLRPYQQTGVAWLQALQQLGLGACLADDMGLGKTVQIIAHLVLLKHAAEAKRPTLLVLPASLIGNWQAEFTKFAPSLRLLIAHGSAGEVAKSAPADIDKIDVVVTTYGMLYRLDWLAGVHWQLVIADEAQAIKNAHTRQSRAISNIAADGKIAMTGTPIENSLTDLWSLFAFINPGLLGSQQRFSSTVTRLKEQEGTTANPYQPLRDLISPYILRRKKTDKTVISDLPDKVEMKANCFLTKKQASLYQKEVDRLVEALQANEESSIKRKGQVLSSLTRLKQICNHPSQYLADNSYDPALSGKFKRLREIASEVHGRGEKLLVFSQFRELTDILAHELGQIFAQEGLVLHGGTAVKQRQKIVDQFQSPSGPPFLVLSLKAGGTGLTLTAANHVIHFDRWWNPAVENQATDRAFRIGQRKNVLVHKFVCRGTIEEKIDQMLADKQQLADALIEGSKEIKLTELSNEALLELVRLDIQAVAGSD